MPGRHEAVRSVDLQHPPPVAFTAVGLALAPTAASERFKNDRLRHLRAEMVVPVVPELGSAKSLVRLFSRQVTTPVSSEWASTEIHQSPTLS